MLPGFVCLLVIELANTESERLDLPSKQNICLTIWLNTCFYGYKDA